MKINEVWIYDEIIPVNCMHELMFDELMFDELMFEKQLLFFIFLVCYFCCCCCIVIINGNPILLNLEMMFVLPW